MTSTETEPGLAAKSGDTRGDRLFSAAEAAIRHVRGAYLRLIVVSAYIAIVVATTRDEQLLLVAPVTLPLLGVTLPIVGFYALIPWALVLLHVDLLLQLYLVAATLHRLDEIVNSLHDDRTRADIRVSVYPFAFAHMLIGRHHGRLVRVMLAGIVWLTMLAWPIGLLLAIQARFLPYHNSLITWNHRAVVLVDLALLGIIWPMIVSRPGEAGLWWRSTVQAVISAPFRLWQGVRRALAWRARGRRRSDDSAKDMVVDRYREPLPRHRGVLALIALVTVPTTTMVLVIPGEPLDAVARPLGITSVLFDGPRAPFHRSLRLSERILTGRELTPREIVLVQDRDKDPPDDFLEQVPGVILTKRDLRFADFRGTVLINANLRGVLLDGADLRGAKLDGADLRPAETAPGAGCSSDSQVIRLDPHEAEFMGLTAPPQKESRFCAASLRQATVEGARLAKAKLQFANLTQADIGSARLVYANLYRADLTQAQGFGVVMDGANAIRAKAASARLPWSTLRDTNWSGASMEAADLSGADLTGADLSGAYLSRADLREATLTGAAFPWAILDGANLSVARLEMTTLMFTRMIGTDLRAALLYGADLHEASLRGADLSHADMRFADLRKVRVQPLDEKEYGQLQQDDKQRLGGDVSSEALARLWLAVGRPTNVAAAESVDGAICDDLRLFGRACRGTIEVRDARITPLLGDMACREKGIARNTAALAGLIEWQDSRRDGFTSAVRRRLSMSDCTAGKELTEEAFAAWLGP